MIENMHVYNLFLLLKTISEHENKNISYIARKSNKTHGYTLIKIKEFDAIGLLTLTPNGRNLLIKLTPKGIALFDVMQKTLF